MAIGFPQEFNGVGGAGITCAAATQETVEPAGAGTVKVGGLMVYV
jgi:hypothetical protein